MFHHSCKPGTGPFCVDKDYIVPLDNSLVDAAIVGPGVPANTKIVSYVLFVVVRNVFDCLSKSFSLARVALEEAGTKKQPPTPLVRTYCYFG